MNEEQLYIMDPDHLGKIKPVRRFMCMGCERTYRDRGMAARCCGCSNCGEEAIGVPSGGVCEPCKEDPSRGDDYKARIQEAIDNWPEPKFEWDETTYEVEQLVKEFSKDTSPDY